ncbi:hypothetical protein Tco_0693021 [Tanacetum coccineum]
MKDCQEGTEQEAGANVNSVVNDVSSSWAQNEKEAGGSSTQIRRENRPRNPPRNLDLPRIYVKNRGRLWIDLLGLTTPVQGTDLKDWDLHATLRLRCHELSEIVILFL